MTVNLSIFRAMGCTLALTSFGFAQGLPERVDPLDPSGQASGAVGVPFAISGGFAPFESVNGALVASGEGYKVALDEVGMRFTPALGEAAEVSQPLGLSLESIQRGGNLVHAAQGGVAPRLVGQSVIYDLGGIRERYDVGQEGVKQSFVFDAEPAGQGDLVVRMRVDTTLVGEVGSGIDELELRAGALGGVNIGAVLGIDAAGREQAGHMNFTGGHLELVLPEEFVRTASYPLVLDPPISPLLSLSGSLSEERKCDVAYLAGPDMYLAVWVVPLSSTDRDIHAQRVDSCGRLVGNLIQIDATTNLASDLSVSMVRSRDRFVVSYVRRDNSSRDIFARTVDGSTGSTGPEHIVSSSSLDEFECAVGGSSQTTGSDILVVWSTSSSGLRLAQLNARPDGSLTTVQTLSLDAHPRCRRPSISESGGGAGRYLLGWEVRDIDVIRAQFLDANANTLSARGEMSFPGLYPQQVSVDGDGSIFVLTYSRYERSGVTDRDSFFMEIQRPSSSSGAWTGRYQTNLDPSQGDDDTTPLIASVNGRSIAAYLDRTPAGNYVMRAGSLTETGSWRGRSQTGAENVSSPDIASRQSSGTSLDGAMMVYSGTPPGGSTTIRGWLWHESPVSGQFTINPTGCGGLGIQASGVPSIGDVVDVQLTNTAGSSSTWLGAIPSTLPLCGGCTLGVTGVITFSGAGTGPLTIPLDPCLIGESVYVQGADLFSSGGCTRPFNFRLSDTVRIRIGS